MPTNNRVVIVSGRTRSLDRLLVAPAVIATETVAFVVLVLLSLVLGIERVLYSWYFATCVALCLASLVAATARMVMRDVRVSRARRTVRVRSGTVLHIGLVSTLVFSAVALLSESQGIYVLVEGQTLPAGATPVTLVRGPVATAFTLPESLGLVSVSPAWWSDGSLRQLSSQLVLGGTTPPVALAVNGSRTVNGVRYFQDQRYGPAYFLTLTAPDGTVQKQRADLPQPEIGIPTYLDVSVGDGTLLRTRCQVASDSAGATALAVKIVTGGSESDVATLGVGASAQVGGWTVNVDDQRTWAAFILSRQPSVWPLFGSFLVVCVAAIMMYAAPVKPTRISPDDREGADGDGVAA